MKIKDLETWKPTVITYWTQQITASPYDNKIALLSDLNSKINSLSVSAYYLESSLLSKTKDALISLVSYVNLKYLTVYPKGPSIPDLFNDSSGCESWYQSFTTDLPSASNVFTFSSTPILYSGSASGISGLSGISGYTHSDPSSGYSGYSISGYNDPQTMDYSEFSFDGVLNWNIDIPNLINSCASSDIATITSFISGVPTLLKDNVIYRMFTSDQPQTVTKTTKEYILTDLNLGSVLDEFNWQIQGLNS